MPRMISLKTDTQVIPQQDIQIGSQTDVNPITGVYPNVIYQPNIQLYNPLVSTYQSETPYDYYGNDYGNDYGYGDYPDDMLPLTSGPGIAINKRQAPIIPGDSLVGPLDALNDITTNTLIKPIISIQPHALKPVPVPVSRPYTVPVPIGIPASWRGEWYDDCDGYDSHGWDDDCDGYDDHDWDDDCDE
ncbi:hypothetical protein BGZ76_005608 [Entomortierella beljakovae]|nr:hypothetical protein BGZ76_005608 [Entomortierella beljakovae]